MTPATGWTEQAYYHASRSARRAWEQSQPQLLIDLWPDDRLEDAPRGGIGASSSPPPYVGRGLKAGVDRAAPDRPPVPVPAHVSPDVAGRSTS